VSVSVMGVSPATARVRAIRAMSFDRALQITPAGGVTPVFAATVPRTWQVAAASFASSAWAPVVRVPRARCRLWVRSEAGVLRFAVTGPAAG